MDNISLNVFFFFFLNHNPKKVASFFFLHFLMMVFAEISQTQVITAFSAHDGYFILL